MKTIFSSKIILMTIILSTLASVMIVGATILAILAYTNSLDQTYKAEERAKIGAKQSYASCIRSRKFSPIISKGYEKYHFFENKKQSKEYRDTIPKVCHK